MVYTVNGVNYTRRKKIPVTGAGSGAQTNYQIKLAAIWAAAMQADFDDVRFTKADMQTLIDAWLESKVNSTSAVIWAEFPNTPADGVVETEAYMYFGNSAVASDWDIGATFVFGDDFPGSSIDTGKWDGKTSNASVSGGIMSYGGDSTQDRMTSITQFGVNTACRSKIKFLTPTSYIDMFGFENPATAHKSVVYAAYTPANYGISKDGTTQTTVSTNIPFNSWSIFDIRVLGGTNMSWFYDDVEGTNSPKTTNPSNTSDLELIFLGRSTSACIQSEWAFVRKYVANPPTATFGTEEHQRRTPMMM